MKRILPEGRLICLACLLMGTSLVAHPDNAFGNKDTGRERTLDWNTVKQLVTSHPALAAAEYQIEAAQNRVGSATAADNPELEGAVGYGRARDGDQTRVEWGISLSIPLDWIARRNAQGDAARALVKSAEQEKAVLKRDILLALRLLFVDVLYHQQRVRVFESLAEEGDRLSRLVDARVQNGESRSVEAVQMRVEAEKISAALVLARAELQISRDRLGVWLASPPGTVILATGDVSALPAEPSTDREKMEHSIAQHPIYGLAEAELAVAAASARREEREKIPAFAMTPFFDSELDRRAFGVGVSMSLPLWNRNRGNIDAARSQIKSREASLENVKRELQGNLLEYQTSCRAAIAVAARFRDVILPDADTAASTMRRTWELGETTLFEVISANRMRIEVQLELVSAFERAQQSCSRFSIAAGEEL